MLRTLQTAAFPPTITLAGNLTTGGNPGFQEQLMYTVEYYDDEDMRPCWCVVEWSENPHRGITIDRCDNQAEAESLVVAYSMIDRLTTA